MSIPHPELPIGAFLAVGCLMLCLPSHIRVGNVASASMNIWFTLVCLISGINSLIWATDITVQYPIWCDIVTKILISSNVAFPAAAFSICRFLCDVARPNAEEQTLQTRRNRAYMEILLCWVQPLVIMALHYVVQGHRYDIYQYIGCQPTYYSSWAGLFIINVPPLVYCFGTFVYAGLAFYYFLQRRRDFELLTKMSPGMNANHYIRLMVVAMAEMVWGTPWYLFVFVSQFTTSFRPWVSWDYVHYDWDRVGQYPLGLLTAQQRNIHLVLWWVVPVSGFLFFFFFGFSDQAMRDYRAAIWWVRIHVLRKDTSRVHDRFRKTNGFRPTQRRSEGFEDFAKNLDVDIPCKVLDEEAMNNPDTWSGWANKVAKEDAAHFATSATSLDDVHGLSNNSSRVHLKSDVESSLSHSMEKVSYEDARQASPPPSIASGTSHPACCFCHLPRHPPSGYTNPPSQR